MELWGEIVEVWFIGADRVHTLRSKGYDSKTASRATQFRGFTENDHSTLGSWASKGNRDWLFIDDDDFMWLRCVFALGMTAVI